MSQTQGKNYKKAVQAYARDLNNTAKRVLGRRTIGKNKTYGEASGKLRKSLTYKVKGSEIIFESNQRSAKFIYWGVNGTERNYDSPFSYKSKQPPIDPIVKWMRVKPVRLRDPETGSFIKQTESGLRSAAYFIAKAIKEKGIPSLKYYDLAFNETINKWKPKLEEAMLLDWYDEINKQLKDNDIETE